MNNKISKDALCIRNTSSWAHVKPEHKFDSSKFNPDVVNADLINMSPKIDALIKKIYSLDENDMKTDGKYYKHIIYSDVSGVYGAKMVASVLIANGFTLVYNNGFKMKDTSVEPNKSFGLLTTSTVYKKPLPAKLKKNMMMTMNKRPDNVYGENIRILVLDGGFKEGIDVFDVKYMHLLEPLVTKAEQTQVIGRGTRYCGQAGLPFVPMKGWPLHVYRYNMMYDENTSVHELYLKHSNQNISALNFIADLEDLVITSAVDLPLTENIHRFQTSKNRFYIMVQNIMDSIRKKDNTPLKKLRKDFIHIVNNIRGKIYTNEKNIDCRLNCKGPLEMAPKAILLIAAIHVGHKDLIKHLDEKFAKPLLCNQISKMPEYCKTINQIWLSPIRFLKIYRKTIEENLEYYKRAYMIHRDNYSEIKEFIKKYLDDIVEKPKQEIKYVPIPPPNKMSHLDLHNYIQNHYKEFEWGGVDIVNNCMYNTQEKLQNDQYELVKFTNTQEFVQRYFTPSSPYKGIFLYHSVGSGKTCSAIATASNSFDKEGYNILWVTRHTLKEDIWKNMFDKVCNILIQEKIKRGEKIPKLQTDKMRMLGKNWMQPISYKQFTNLIQGKNKFYQQMVALNGKEDPFKKTLVIIDEVHKIYSSSLQAIEKPDPIALQNMIQNSFEKSGDKSVRMLVMTATPMTEDPMSCIKIINLLLPKDEQFTEDFESFKADYCHENGIFSDSGALNFMNRTAGIISYVDRSGDQSQFAYPELHDILLKDDDKGDTTNKIIDIIRNLKQRLEENESRLKDKSLKLSKDDIKLLKEDTKNIKKQIKANEKAKNDPRHIVDFINNCFIKDAKKTIARKPKDIEDEDDDEKPQKERKVPKEKIQKDCKPGQIRNPETGRCKQIPKEPKEPKEPKKQKIANQDI
jgi:hypothetical protein